MAKAGPGTHPAPCVSPAPPLFTFPTSLSAYAIYQPLKILKKATYKDFHTDTTTTIQASWGPMTMIGSHYLVQERLDSPSCGVYGATVPEFRASNTLVEGDKLGEGVWYKSTKVSAVQVERNMMVRTVFGEHEETSVVTNKGDWVIRQDGSGSDELMVLRDENFRARYEFVAEG